MAISRIFTQKNHLSNSIWHIYCKNRKGNAMFWDGFSAFIALADILA